MHEYKFRYTIIFLLVYVSIANAQEYRNLTSLDGLTQNSIFSISQDTLGYIWLGNQLTLDRYDGSEIKSYDLNKDGFVKCVKSHGHTTWVSKGATLWQFEYNVDDLAYGYRPLVTGSSLDSEIIDIDVSNDSILFILTKKEILISKKQPYRELARSDIKKALGKEFVDLDYSKYNNTLYVSTDENVYAEKINPSDLNIDFKESLNIESKYSKVLIKDSILWIGKQNSDEVFQGLVSFNVLNNGQVEYSLGTDLEKSKTSITDICFLNGRLAVATSNMGVYGIDSDSLVALYQKKSFDNQNQISSNLVTSIFQSRIDNTIWIGTDGRGVNLVRSNRPKIFHLLKEMKSCDIGFSCNNDSWSIYSSDEDSTIWIGTDYNGIVPVKYSIGPDGMLKEYVLDHIKNENTPTSNVIYQIKPHKDRLILGTKNGIQSTERSSPKLLTQEYFDHKEVRAVLPTNQGYLAGFDSLLFFLDEGFRKDSLIHHFDSDVTLIEMLFEGHFLVGTKNGLFTLNIGGEIEKVNGSDKLYILSTYYDRSISAVWVGTRQGLGKFKYSLEGMDSLEMNGLFNESVVYSIVPDDFETVWMSTNSGLLRYHQKSELIYNYTELDGLQFEEFNTGSFHKSEYGNLFFGGVNGINLVIPNDPASFDRSNNRILYYKNEGLVNTYVGLPERLTIPYDFKNIQLKLVNLDFRDPRNYNIQFKTEFDTVWRRAPFGSINLERSILNNPDFDLFIKYESGIGWKEKIIRIERDGFTIQYFWKGLVESPTHIKVFVIFLISFIFYSVYFIQKTIRKFTRDKNELRLRNDDLGSIQNFNNFIRAKDNINDLIRIIPQILKNARPFQFREVRILKVDYIRRVVQELYATSTAKSKVSYTLIGQNSTGNEGKSSGVGVYLNDNENLVIGSRIKAFELGESQTTLIIPLSHARDVGKDELDVIPSLTTTQTNDGDEIIGFIEVTIEDANRTDYQQELVALFASSVTGVFKNLWSADQLVENQEIFNNINDALIEKAQVTDLRAYSIEFVKFLQEFTCSTCVEITHLDGWSFNWDNTTSVIYPEDLFTEESLKKLRNSAFSSNSGLMYQVVEYQTPQYTGDIKSEPYYFDQICNEKSQLSVPLIIDHTLVGIINLYSQEKYFFDDHKLRRVESLGKHYLDVYQSKRLNAKQQKMITPFNVFGKTESNVFDPMRSVFEEFFFSDKVGIWWKKKEQGSSGIDNIYELKSAGKGFNSMLKSFDLSVIRNPRTDKVKSNLSFDIGNTREISEFSTLFDQDGIGSMVYVPILFGNQKLGMICTFLRSKTQYVLGDDDQGLLTQLANKTAFAAQTSRIQDFFIDVTNRLVRSQDEDGTLRHITNSAKDIVLADSVIVFPYDRHSRAFKNECFKAGVFTKTSESNFNKINPQTPLLKAALRYDLRKFQSDKEFDDFLIDHKIPIRPQSFRKREGIKTTLIFRLGTEKIPLGLMFFNFNEETELLNEALIESFSQLAANAMVGVGLLSRIHDNVKKLESEKSEIELEREKLTKRNQEIRKNIREQNQQINSLTKLSDEIMQRVSRSSYYMVLQGVAHDIRNFFIRQVDLLDDLEDNMPKGQNNYNRFMSIKRQLDEHIELIEDLLQLFDLKVDDIKSINVLDDIKKVLKFFVGDDKYGKKIKIEVLSKYKRLPQLDFNQTEFAMIIYNLVSNAIHAISKKYVEKDPELTEGRITISVNYIDNQFDIRVRDNGCGIPKDKMNSLTTLGYTTRSFGLGIGLYFVEQTITEIYFGQFKPSSSLGNYTEMKLLIPDIKRI